jgi:hypothetical protein
VAPKWHEALFGFVVKAGIERGLGLAFSFTPLTAAAERMRLNSMGEAYLHALAINGRNAASVDDLRLVQD